MIILIHNILETCDFVYHGNPMIAPGPTPCWGAAASACKWWPQVMTIQWGTSKMAMLNGQIAVSYYL